MLPVALQSRRSQEPGLSVDRLTTLNASSSLPCRFLLFEHFDLPIRFSGVHVSLTSTFVSSPQ